MSGNVADGSHLLKIQNAFEGSAFDVGSHDFRHPSRDAVVKEKSRERRHPRRAERCRRHTKWTEVVMGNLCK